MLNSQARFKWVDDKLINLIKCLEEIKVPWNSEIATQTLAKSSYMKVREKVKQKYMKISKTPYKDLDHVNEIDLRECQVKGKTEKGQIKSF